MKKWGKSIIGLAALGSALAGLIYYFKKKESCEDDDFDDDFEDDDFDLDSDLKPVSDREYVSLNPSVKSEEDTEEASGETAAKEAELKEADDADADEDDTDTDADED